MTTEANEQPTTWTWADQVSSWRFWGLLLSFLLTVCVTRTALNMAGPFLTDVAGLRPVQISIIVSVHWLATGMGFPLAWLAIRWRPVPSLVLLAVMMACGLMLLFHRTAPSWSEMAGFCSSMTGSVLVGLSTGAFSLAVTAIIVGRRGSAEAFLVSFGVVSAFGTMGAWVAARVVAACASTWGMGHVAFIAAVPVVAGAAILLTVRAELFTGRPPERGYTLSPLARRPVAVALLFCVPFYGLYWLYRAHGEVAAVAPSRTLLSPRAALFGSLFVPFLSLVAMTSLIDALNRQCQERGRPRLFSPVLVFLCAMFCAPLAGALIQSGLNELLKEQPQQSAQ